MQCETARVEYDPTQFSGTARYYRQGRPLYSAQLADVLARELRLDGTSQLLDVGSGPGTVGVELAPLFGESRCWSRTRTCSPRPGHTRRQRLTAIDSSGPPPRTFPA